MRAANPCIALKLASSSASVKRKCEGRLSAGTSSAQELRACAWLRTEGWTKYPQGDACLVLPCACVLWYLDLLAARCLSVCLTYVPALDVCAGPQSGTLYANGGALLLVAMLLCCFGSGTDIVFLFICLRTYFWEVRSVYLH